MRRRKMIMAAAMGFVMFANLIAGAGGMRVAAAEERSYQEKYDKVFEDFNREEITDTVTLSSRAIDSGKAYLEVTYGEATTTPDDAIYKQALPGDAGRGNLVIIMRSPDGSASLEDIFLGTRYNDSFPVYGKSLSQLNDANLDPLPELKEEYQKYVINFANSYEDSEVYEGSDIAVNSGMMAGFHLYSAAGTEGTIEISQLYFTTDDSDNVEAARTMLNNFMGGDRVDVTAKLSTNGTTWWCGSATGIIRPRSITLTKDASVEIINAANKAEDYKYAVIEAAGDVENLLVATHNGGFSEVEKYTGKIAVESGTDGFKLIAGGESVSVYRIFYTNLEEDVIATEMPYFDVNGIQLLDHFNVSQTGITGDYDAMSTKPEVEASNVYYRLSYNNSDKVSIENGTLILDASALAENDYINFKTESKTPCMEADYVVIKMKAEDGANLSGFRFGIGGDIIWGNGGLVSATGLPIASPEDTEYAYRTSDGYSYIIVDIKESGLGMPETGAAVMDMYYSGTGKLIFDEIFFAKKQETKYVTANVCQEEAVTYVPEAEGYQWLGYVSAMNDHSAPYLVLHMRGTEGAALDSVRLEFKNKEDSTIGVFWFSENAEGTLRGTDGNLLPALSTETAEYVIDLAKSGISADIGAFHVHSGGSAVGGQITLEKVNYVAEEKMSYEDIMSALPVYEVPDMIAPVVELSAPKNAVVGDTVKVEAKAQDDSGNVVLMLSVIKDGKEVALTDNAFVAEEGVYTITATATDGSENETTQVLQTTVTAKAAETAETEKTEQTEQAEQIEQTVSGNNTNNGAVIWIAVAAVAVVLAAIIVMIIKKKRVK